MRPLSFSFVVHARLILEIAKDEWSVSSCTVAFCVVSGKSRIFRPVDTRQHGLVLAWPPARESEIFLATDLSFAFVNLKPVLPGHVLISPKRIVRRFKDLSPEEVGDVWSLAQRVGAGLESHLKVDSLTLAIQDGPAAGQTVPHVHIHCLPRRFGDFENNDDVYDAIDESSKVSRDPQKLDLDKPRVVRGPEEMAEEAAEFRKLFEQ
ncbi:hypothetical protein BSKO_11534 [Bryopsis sp. KO-2023]|nr:hypothetical protein BSKO_11534 [Bryopsis sp. KO-2023]